MCGMHVEVLAFCHMEQLGALGSVCPPRLSETKITGSPYLTTISLAKASQTVEVFLDAMGIDSAQPVR